MKQETRFYLIFSEAHPDGVRLDQDQYQRLLKSMNRMDRETHMAVEIARGAETFADLMIEESKGKKPA